jgi:O-acetyl-ADP-ribose deacetylase (regulator of RNase III)
MRVEIIEGDITTQQIDAIVNAANSSLLGGGGVDGAIHRAAGPELLAACEQLRATTLPDGLPVGQAVATPGFKLPARWVIHTVGPNAHRGQTDPSLLEDCFRNSLLVAQEIGAKQVAFPAISAGVYGWDAADVAACAHRALDSFASGDEPVDLVRFVLFSDRITSAFRAEFGQ